MRSRAHAHAWTPSAQAFIWSDVTEDLRIQSDSCTVSAKRSFTYPARPSGQLAVWGYVTTMHVT